MKVERRREQGGANEADVRQVSGEIRLWRSRETQEGNRPLGAGHKRINYKIKQEITNQKSKP